MKPQYLLVFLTLAAAAGITGCTSLNTPSAQDQLRWISAGHTGCLPDDNVISNSVTDGSRGSWNATCKGKTYLCSAVSAGSSSAFSCAPVAQ
jgi:hypothetical protein